jgi:hypothetical protein
MSKYSWLPYFAQIALGTTGCPATFLFSDKTFMNSTIASGTNNYKMIALAYKYSTIAQRSTNLSLFLLQHQYRLQLLLPFLSLTESAC